MSKTYVRVDDRLIHGQTIMSWAPTLKLEEFIAVDDTIAANPMLKSILTMGVPKNYVTHIVSTEEARALLAQGAARTPGASSRPPRPCDAGRARRRRRA